MRVVRKFQVDDGELFDDSAKARRYEATKEIEARFREKFSLAFSVGRAESLFKMFMSEPRWVRDTLTELLKKTKSEEAEAEPDEKQSEPVAPLR